MSAAGTTMLAARGRARWLATVDPAQVRRDCGITQQTIATALGVTRNAVSVWERGKSGPTGPHGDAYCRVIAGLRRHLAVTW